MLNPVDMRTGGSSAATTRNRYQGWPMSSERSTPNTSQATANSNGEVPWPTMAATVCRLLFFRWLAVGMAGSSRPLSILSLAGSLWPAQSRHMFAVWCPGHGSRVLLWADCITDLDNSPDGPILGWRCPWGRGGQLVGTRHTRVVPSSAATGRLSRWT